MPPTVRPQILRGFRDFMPERMILRNYVISQLRDVFESYGFEPLDTPAIEYAETLEGKFGEEGDKLLYRWEDRGQRRVALRYDLTVPLARVVAMHGELVRPFKRYHIAPVWRAEKPQKGRYREFWQCDVDTVGTRNVLADAECVNVVYDALRRLGFQQFVVHINNRKVLEALAVYAGVPAANAGGVYRSIDKLDKIGREAVQAELQLEGLSERVSSSLLDLLTRQADDDQLLAEASRLLADSPQGREGLAELEQVLSHLRASGIPDQFRRIDLAMVRGMDYYTGPIFETVVEEPRIGSISGGGRYDNLVGIFSKESIPATGISIGLERIIDVIEDLGMRPQGMGSTVANVLITNYSAETLAESMRLASELRQSGLNAELYLNEDRIGNQLKYAVRKGIPYAVIIGPDELGSGQAVVRNLVSASQNEVALPDVAEYLRRAIGE